MNNIKIMVLGYNDYDEDETVIDFVNIDIVPCECCGYVFDLEIENKCPRCQLKEEEVELSEFDLLKEHVGHNIECVTYGDVNVSVECMDCCEVLYSIDREL